MAAQGNDAESVSSQRPTELLWSENFNLICIAAEWLSNKLRKANDTHTCISWGGHANAEFDV